MNLKPQADKSQLPVQVEEKWQLMPENLFSPILSVQRELASIHGNDGIIIANRSGDARADIWDYFVLNLQALQLI